MSLPPETTLDEVKVRIRNATKNPNVGRTEQVVLKEGPRAFRLATLMEIIKPDTGEVHHHVLKLDSIDRTKDGWFHKPAKSLSLEGSEQNNEIDRLFTFLKAHLDGKLNTTGELHILRSSDYDKLARLVDLIPNLASPDMVELVKLIVPRIKESAAYFSEFVEVFKASDAETVNHLATAARLVQYTQAFETLKALVETGDAQEATYQKLLAENAWMFGSEYSELLDRRKWTRDESVDFMLRRTSDNYVELIEIKTPFKESLFIRDPSHESYYPSARLSPVVGQVMKYIGEVERARDQILVKDKVDTLKVRARIIVGRDGTDEQQQALRTFNGHLHGIEIITYDQLMRIAQRVLNIFTGPAPEKAAMRESTPF
ncbi:Shedu anti-phage system protein SduA domain-containing protein [Hydrogenophaga sp.]|uniref:Shedu anti-phage system protein SduA domain-containing protein n=1 Tax=Hydrogenophaga sp. TaxID=1904254 RepID=UPI002FCC958A